MRVLMGKLILAAALILLAFSVSSPAQSGDARPAKEEKEAAAELTRLDVPLQRDSHGVARWIEATRGEMTDEALRLLPGLPALEWLEIAGGNVTASGIANLKKCPLLRRLYVHDVNIGGDSLPWLSDLKNLEALSLQRTGIDGTVLKNLKSQNLVVLNLSGNKIVDQDMEQIAQLKSLEVLALADTKVTGPGLAKLEGMASLNELNLMNCNIADDDIEVFLSTPNLRIVYASGCGLSEIAVASVVARFPMLAIFR
jgi:Leucine-rich repeat (LRR) protein